MEGERHVVIEKPDGSLVVGFNEEVPVPPPEEVVVTITDGDRKSTRLNSSH